ncbi:MAG TPA: ATP-binding protein [Gemmatimonadaceae bacterium]|nr:ATP-binding protein [Gemmatimonadaceae bacterium]
MNSRTTERDKNKRGSGATRLLRDLVVAFAPPLVAFAGEWSVFAALGSRWLLMVGAVIVSAANGGMLAGLVATITSAALVWWFLVPPVRTLGTTDPRYYLSVVLFLAVGYAISLLHERLRRTTDGLARAARQNHIFAALIENSVDFIGIADPEGLPRYVNPAGRRMVELPGDIAIEDTRIPDYYPPSVRPFAYDVILTEMLANDKWAGETSFRNWRTGAGIPVLDTHFLIRDPLTRRVIGMGTITRDISEQKAQLDLLERTNQQLASTMRELAENQRYLQGLLDYSPNAIVIKDLEGRYVLANNEFRAIAGLGPTVARAKSDAALFPESLARRLRANDQMAIASRKAVVTEESLGDGRDERAYLVTTFPLFGEAVTIFALCGIWTDITKLKDLQRLRDEWTSVIAHDLRQPIGAILMASDLLPELHREAVSAKEQAFIQRIHTAAESLRRMVDDLLDLSVLETKRLKLERRWSNPHDLVRGTVERLAHLPGIARVQVRGETDVPSIFVDSMRIDQVLTNLISNAIKYSDEHSDIIVQIEQREDEVRIAVTNHGRGIAADDLPRLFNRFMRSKETRGSGVPGLGLGLYIAKGVIEAHGGRLWAESKPGQTTTFHVALPISAKVREAA